MSLPSASCVGYSWLSHILLPQQLKLCLCERNPLHVQWTTPFSIDGVGVRCVCVPMGVCVARAYVEVTSIGGLQRQVRSEVGWVRGGCVPMGGGGGVPM